jgi:hypothetical protein
MARRRTRLVGGRLGVAQGLARGAGDGGALARRARGADDACAGVARDRGGGVRGAVVGDPDRRAWKRAGERVERRGDALRLVVSGDDDDRGRAGGSVGDAVYCASPIVPGRALASSVWRSE